MRKLITTLVAVLLSLGFALANEQYETSQEARKAAEYYERQVANCEYQARVWNCRDGIDSARNSMDAEKYRALAIDARRQQRELESQGK